MPRRKSVPRKNWTPRKRFAGRRMRRPRRVVGNLNYCMQRCTQVKTITMPAGENERCVVIPWQQTEANVPQGHRYITFDKTPRFNATQPTWQEYSITGLKIEYMPYWTQSNLGTPGAWAMAQFFMNSSTNGYLTLPGEGNNDLMSMPGFKSLSPHRPFKRFISCKKLSKQMNVSWQPSDQYASNLPNELTSAASMFKFRGQTTPTFDVELGTFKVTWYIRMRGQRNPDPQPPN